MQTIELAGWVLVAIVVLLGAVLFTKIIRHDIRGFREKRAAAEHLARLRERGLSDDELRIEEYAYWDKLRTEEGRP